MGRPKALLPVRGVPLGAVVARAVALAAGSATLVGGADWAEELGFPAIPDLYPGEGPLGGILTALRHTAADWNLVVACDMPRLSAYALENLFAACPPGADAAVPLAAGRPEPLCAVYRRAALGPMEAAFAAGIRQVTRAFEGLRVAWIETPDVELFQNLNTPEEWAAYAAE